MAARQRSLRYLERLRIGHALVTVALTIGLLAWVLLLWQQGRATTGDVILVCTLGLSVLHATRDLAIALVDVTQHAARFAEALRDACSSPTSCAIGPTPKPLARGGISVKFDRRGVRLSRLPTACSTGLNFTIESGQKVGLVGASGGGKTTILALIQRFYDIDSGRILIADHDVTEVTQQSLREAIAVVPQDISLFHRSLMENIRYARPEASDERGVGGGRRRTLRLHRPTCHRGSTPWSVIAARACPADSASALRSPAPSSRTRRCFCSTRPPRRSIANRRRPSAKPWRG